MRPVSDAEFNGRIFSSIEEAQRRMATERCYVDWRKSPKSINPPDFSDIGDRSNRLHKEQKSIKQAFGDSRSRLARKPENRWNNARIRSLESHRTAENFRIRRALHECGMERFWRTIVADSEGIQCRQRGDALKATITLPIEKFKQYGFDWSLNSNNGLVTLNLEFNPKRSSKISAYLGYTIDVGLRLEAQMVTASDNGGDISYQVSDEHEDYQGFKSTVFRTVTEHCEPSSYETWNGGYNAVPLAKIVRQNIAFTEKDLQALSKLLKTNLANNRETNELKTYLRDTYRLAL